MVSNNWYYSLLPSQATIFTLSTRANSCTSRNSTSFNINVQTLSQNRYVFNLAALNVTRALTFVLSAVFMDLSNCSRTLSASCGVIWPNFGFCEKQQQQQKLPTYSVCVCVCICVHIPRMQRKQERKKNEMNYRLKM